MIGLPEGPSPIRLVIFHLATSINHPNLWRNITGGAPSTLRIATRREAVLLMATQFQRLGLRHGQTAGT